MDNAEIMIEDGKEAAIFIAELERQGINYKVRTRQVGGTVYYIEICGY